MNTDNEASAIDDSLGHAPHSASSEDASCKQDRRWLIGIVILSAILRLSFLGSRSLHHAESWPVNAVAQPSWSQAIERAKDWPEMPPAFGALLRVMWLVGGKSELCLRLPGAIIGILTVPILYLVGLRMTDRRTALLSALLLAVMPCHVYFSRELKQYPIAAFVGTLLLLLALRIREKPAPLRWLAWSVVAAIGPWFDYSASLPFAATGGIMFLWFAWRRDWRAILPWAGASALAGISVLLAYSYAAQQHEGMDRLNAFWGNYFMDFSGPSA